LIIKSKGRINILPGSGIDENKLESLHLVLNASEYHSSAKAIKPKKESRSEISMSSVSDKEQKEWVVSRQIVNRLKKIGVRL
jgi:copper homeostasis protein CutC